MAYRNTPSSTRNRSARPSGNRPGVRSFRPGKSGARNGQKRGAYIHPSKFINRAVTRAQETPYEATHQFTDFNFTARLQANIDFKGYTTPSAIQDQAIPFVLKGQDVIGLANTGTGKTDNSFAVTAEIKGNYLTLYCFTNRSDILFYQ
jgi:hypothetical protein